MLAELEDRRREAVVVAVVVRGQSDGLQGLAEPAGVRRGAVLSSDQEADAFCGKVEFHIVEWGIYQADSVFHTYC